MEDYIFLFIAILLSIFGAINQNKKKGIQQSEPEEPQVRDAHRNPFLNFELMDVEDEEDAYERKARDDAKRADFLRRVEEKKEQASRSTLSQSTLSSSTLPDRPKKKVIKPAMKVIETEESTTVTGEGTSYFEDFSLRKAIIYSEILQPKYKSL